MAIKKYQTRVPSAYQEVEYLKSNGAQYIDTGIIPTNSAQTKVQFEFQLTDITNGLYQSIGCNSNINFTSSQTQIKFRSNAVVIADFDTAWHVCEMSKSSSGKVTYFDGTEYSTSTTTEEALPFLLFSMSLSSDRYYGKYKLKYFKCYENNTLVRNMIPVRRVSDNVLGMYDIVNDVFYVNQGTGAFEAGADVDNWHTIPYRKYESATDTITTLPKTIITDGQSASAVIKGNLSQSGTPTPANPIYPQETGDKTANKFDYKTAYAQYLSGDDVVITPLQMTAEKQYFTSSEVGTEITISVYAKTVTSNRVYIRASINGANVNSNSISRNNSGLITVTVTPTSTNDFFNLTYGDGGDYNTFNKFMVNTGSTALPYQPYGYKIPILSANTTTPVYLGQVESTRNIAKYEFTGQEDWTEAMSGTNNHFFQLIQSQAKDVGLYEKCTHFICTQISSNNTDVGFCVTSGGGAFRIRPENTATTTLTTFKQWLADQYTNGTPVTVWYVLAEATTGIVNEPIRKISTYADSVSVTGIPTTGTAESFDIDTTLKPSEVQLTYHGWHEHSDTKYTT